MENQDLISPKAELIKADQALKSFRDGGYTLNDALGELVDNPLDSGATKVWIEWKTSAVKVGNSTKTRTQIDSFAVCDNGQGISANVLANVLTVGFSTRFGRRNTIGRFGVGFKLASISQCKRIEVYSKPAYLTALPPTEDGDGKWTFKDDNRKAGRIFRTVMDLGMIERKEQLNYTAEEATAVEDYAHLLDSVKSGTLVVWRDCDRLNATHPYSETPEELLSDLEYFLSRTYRQYIADGLEIYLNGASKALYPYDPSFVIDNPGATQLANGETMRGEDIDAGHIEIDGHRVDWAVTLTPKITRLKEGGGGVDGPAGPKQFKKLHIPDNEGKLSFLRRKREISYTQMQRFHPNGVTPLDRYIGITVSFPPELDEYFQVRHIKRGAEPVEKLRRELRLKLEKPIKAARKRIQAVWQETEKEAAAEAPQADRDSSGGRTSAEKIADSAQASLPASRAGTDKTEQETTERLKVAAEEVGIKDPAKQTEFVEKIKQKPMTALDISWPGKGLLDIEHLNQLVLVKINRSHPFIRDIYLPLKAGAAAPVGETDVASLQRLVLQAKDGIDLLLFAYAKAESMSQKPEEDFGMLREDWGKFAAAYLRRRAEVAVE